MDCRKLYSTNSFVSSTKYYKKVKDEGKHLQINRQSPHPGVGQAILWGDTPYESSLQPHPLSFFFSPLSIILINSSRIHRMGSQAGRSQAEVSCSMKLKFKKESRSSQCPQPQGRPLYRVPKADSRVPALRGGRWGSERGRGLWGQHCRDRGFLEPQTWPRVHFSQMSDA